MATDRFSILSITEHDRSEREEVLTRETFLTIVLNDRELVTLLCSPVNLKYLALGFLFSEGLVKSKGEIKEITIVKRRGVVRVETQNGKEFTGEPSLMPLIASSSGRKVPFHGASPVQVDAKVESKILIAPHEVFTLVNEFQHRSLIFQATGGVHSAALCDTNDILVFHDDIGRHNAIDKVFGECIWTGMPLADRMIITSGRVTSEIVLKIAKGKIPLITSISAPTDMAVKLADGLGITLIGFVRGRKMNVYTNRWRIADREDK